MMKRFWTWLIWLFKPTYYVFPSINAALTQLSRRGGGTIRLGLGRYDAEDGIELPEKDVRVIGAGPETILEVSGECAVKMDTSSGARYSLNDLMIQGVVGRGIPSSKILAAYLDLESAVRNLESAENSDADLVRGTMDGIWGQLTSAEHEWLDGRGSPRSDPDQLS